MRSKDKFQADGAPANVCLDLSNVERVPMCSRNGVK